MISDRERLGDLLLYDPALDTVLGNSEDFYYAADRLLEKGVIVPPCKVGETVYCLIQGFENPLKATVNRITVQKDAVIISCSVLGYFGQSYMATDFGKTVFLTKEEAEKALKEKGG